MNFQILYILDHAIIDSVNILDFEIFKFYHLAK